MKTISVVLSPNIKKNTKRGIYAGTENIFIEDCQYLSKKYQLKAFARFKINQIRAKKVPYLRETFKYTPKIIADTLYAFLCHILSSGANLHLTYSFPLLALFRPQRTIVIMQSLSPFFFYSLFKKRYAAAHYICCSNSLKKQLKKFYPDLEKIHPITTIHNSVDTSVFRPPRETQQRHTHTLKILFASAWVYEKGLKILLESLTKLDQAELLRIELTIASFPGLWSQDTNTHQKAYQEQVHKLIGSIKNITLLHGVNRNSMVDLYRKNDYTAFPSIWEEPFGLILLESIASGTPIIAFDKGAVSEIVSSQNSILLKDISSAALANTLSSLLKIKKLSPIKKTSLLTKKNSNMTHTKRKEILLSYLKKIEAY